MAGMGGSSKLRTLGRVAGVAAVVYLGDLWVNDDLDLISKRLRRQLPYEQQQHRPRVVVLGTGWGSLSFMRKVYADRFRVTVVSPRSHFVFTPLLPSAATGEIEARSTIEPFRRYCERTATEHVELFEAEAVAVEPQRHVVTCKSTAEVAHAPRTFELPYDYLLVAVGAQPADFGVPGVMEHALFMRELQHAVAIRRRLVSAFEEASLPGQSEDEIKRLLHFVVVGGGVGGVELAGGLHDIITTDLKRAFPDLAPYAKVTLVEAGDHILSMLPLQLEEYAEGVFRREGIELLTHCKVVKVAADHISVVPRKAAQSTKTAAVKVQALPDAPADDVGQTAATGAAAGAGAGAGQVSEPAPEVEVEVEAAPEDIACGMVVWTAGLGTRPVVRQLAKAIGPAQSSKRGLEVDEHLLVKGTTNVFALGDCADANTPPTAQAASQQGRYLGRMFNEVSELMYDAVLPHNQLMKRTLPAAEATEDAVAHSKAAHHVPERVIAPELSDIEPFKYKHLGTWSGLGERDAVASLPAGPKSDAKVAASGFATYLAWRSVYFSTLLSARNRVIVAFDLLKTTVFGRDITRE